MKISALRRKTLHASVLCALIVLTFVLGDVEGWNQQTNLNKFNYFKKPASQNLVIIEIDDESIEHFNSWPWPRSRFAEFLYKIQESAPKMVAFDLDFSSHTNELDDANFSKAIKAASFPIILPSLSHKDKKSYTNQHEILHKKTPIAALGDYSLIASGDLSTEHSGTVVKYDTYSAHNLPSLGALLANNNATPSKSTFLNLSIDPSSIPYISFRDIVAGHFEPADIRGKILLVGTTSLELGNMYMLPKHGRVPSIFVHALGYETLVSNTQFTEISPFIMFALAIFLVIALTFLHDDKRLGMALFANALVGIIIYITSFWLHGQQMIMLPVAIVYLAIIASSIMQVIQNIRYRAYIMYKETNRNNYNKALVNQVIRESANGIVITDLQGKILVANKKAKQLFSINAYQIQKNESVFDLIPNCQKLFAISHDQNGDNQTTVEAKKITNETGQEFCIEIISSKSNFIQHIYGSGFFGQKSSIQNHEFFSLTITDVTEKMEIIADKNQSENALIDLKSNDPLTKLPNRASFNKVLDLLYSNSHISNSSMITLINLDSIKEINDVFGVEIGDRAIFQVGQLLAGLIGDSGFVSRFSDKAFGIIYNDINTDNQEQSKQLLRQVCHLFSKPLNLHGKNISMNISMGAVLAPQHGETPDILMNNATQALDYSKSSDSLKWFIYQEDLAQRVRTKREVRAELERAIRNEEFVLYYQPQHDIASGKLLGYESLIRWEDPYKGLRYPDDFIPVAEEFGLIAEIGELVLKRGCLDAANWPDDISVAINVSAMQFKNADMVELCRRYLTLSGMAPQRLELEITESMMMDDIENVIETLTNIQALGVKIAMDDFGTGYSSLQYLTELPFDKIKIDRSFTMNIGKSKQTDALISTIVALGHSLDKQVLAEGIETEDMVLMLKAAGCQIGQGYLYGRPMPISHVQAQIDLIDNETKIA